MLTINNNSLRRCLWRRQWLYVLTFTCGLMFAGKGTYAQRDTMLNQPNQAGVFIAPHYINLEQGFGTSSTLDFHALITVQPRPCNTTPTTPSQNQNYVITYTPRVAGAGSVPCLVRTDIQYIDGLGRPSQTVHAHASTDSAKDIVIPISYDAFGREATKFLPYASADNNGSYKPAALTPGDGLSKYYNPTGNGVSGNQQSNGVVITPYPYSKTVYESSPVNRMIEQGAPGNDWQPLNVSLPASGHAIKMDYSTNDTGEVILWQVNSNGATGTSSYDASQLYKTVSADENGNQTQEFKDKDGRIICKKVQADNAGTYYSTYYIYNDLSQLSYVIPQIPGSYPVTFIESDDLFDQYIYGYHYDSRGRLTEKKIPGKLWEYLVYNSLDQVVATQDGNQRPANKWTFTKYDGIGRVIETGEMTDSHDHLTITNAIASQSQNWEVPSGAGDGYSVQSFPQTWNQLYTINYYDDYAYPGSNTYATTASGLNLTAKGLLTGSKVNVLGSSSMLLTELFYDDKGRLSESIAQNHIGGYDRIVNIYDFLNQLISATRTHHSGTVNSLVIKNDYVYDNSGRKIQTFETIANGNKTLISQGDFNDIGQVKSKHLGNNVQQIDYAYNERGWLKAATAPLFAMQLKYNDGTTPQWNGNISNQSWTSADHSSHRYDYSYDKLNRLTAGVSDEGFTEDSIRYDPLGNINSLRRQTNVHNYSYNGNQLQTASGITTGTYKYDSNGNITYDARNNTGIEYDYLNLPRVITDKNTFYTYDANGRKLARTVNGVASEYVDGIQYENGSVAFINTEEGRAVNSNGNYSYEYVVTDHLGNSRVTFDQNSVVKQADDYYPFGLEIAKTPASAIKNNYLYNSKELQSILGQYDYGARFYDPVIGRWTTPDPLAEISKRWSPYGYAINNPIRNIDVDGMLSTHTDEDGNVLSVHNDGDLGVYKHNGATKNDVDKKYSVSNTSGDGIKMGESLQSLSFADQSLYNKTGKVAAADIKIDFGSKELTDKVGGIVNKNPSLKEYIGKARMGGSWDLKSNTENGSLLYGRYASPRDAGNFAAGAVAQMSGIEPVVQFGFGAYNLSKNDMLNTALLTAIQGFTTLILPIGSPTSYVISKYGEDKLSQQAIDIGKAFIKNKK